MSHNQSISAATDSNLDFAPSRERWFLSETRPRVGVKLLLGGIRRHYVILRLASASELRAQQQEIAKSVEKIRAIDGIGR
jgi:hypothetical protein